MRYCSQCDFLSDDSCNFCPNCGTRMRPCAKQDDSLWHESPQSPPQQRTSTPVYNNPADCKKTSSEEAVENWRKKPFWYVIGILVILALIVWGIKDRRDYQMAQSSASSSTASYAQFEAKTDIPTRKPAEAQSSSVYGMDAFINYVKNRMYSDENLKGNCSVDSTDNSVIVWLSFNGLATELMSEMISGTSESHDALSGVILSLCLDLMDKAEDYKADCTIMVALLNDSNPENTLIAYIDGIKVSDYLD